MQPVRHGLDVRPVSAERIAAALADLAALHEQLGRLATATRPAGHAPPGPRTPDLDAIDARYAIANTVTTWCRTALEDAAAVLEAAVGAELPTLAAWLTRWTPWLADQPYAGQLLADLHQAATAARNVLRRGTVAVIGICGCARVHRDDPLLPTVLICDHDRAHRWAAGDWRTLARGTIVRWLRADEAGVMLGVDVPEVYRLASERGWTRTRTRPVGYLASDVAGLTSGAEGLANAR
jgi:hypothetical protein